MKKVSLFISSLCLMFSIMPSLSLKNVMALENDKSDEVIEGFVDLDLNNIEVGDSIKVYENPNTGGKLIIDFLPTSKSRLTTGTGSWSGGTIPSKTVTMYPHYEDKNYNYSDIGFYVTYDGKNKKYLDTYGASVGVLDGTISGLSTKIVTAKPTTSNPAKAQMSWVYKKGSSVSCYLRQDINYKNQSRLAWRF